MAYPTREEALALLEWANEKNPGVWKTHSLGVGRAMREIAAGVGLDAEKAYVLGVLHDIGRYEGWRAMHHVIVGYDLLMERGWDEAARICVTHSFPDGILEHYIGARDVTDEEYARIGKLLEAARPFDDYDRLSQLCDAISWNDGVCLMEKRLVDVVMRHGITPDILDKWKAFFALRDEFSQRLGKSIYALFPECAGNTLGV